MVFVEVQKSTYNAGIFEFMKKICKGIQERYYLWFDALGYEEDHVHLVI